MEDSQNVSQKELDAAAALSKLFAHEPEVANAIQNNQTLSYRVEMTVTPSACNTQGKDAACVKREPDTVGEACYDTKVQNKEINHVKFEDEVVICQEQMKNEEFANEKTRCSQSDTHLADFRITTAANAVGKDNEKVVDTIIVDNNHNTDSDSGGTESESGIDDDSSSEYTQDENIRTKKIKKTALKKPENSRRRPARTAREYIARLHQKEDMMGQAPNSRKRKAETAGNRPQKRTNATKGSAGLDTITHLAQDMAGSSQHAEPLATTMPNIEATTHQKQFALLNSSIPAGADTRRTRTQKRDLHEAAKLFGYKRVEALSGTWLLDGMKTGLRHHQLTAAAWMVKRECARAGPRGGMVADEMGMGKTLTSLACVVGNPPDADDLKTYVSCTLVIVPNVGIADQWLLEIEKHCSDSFAENTLIYHEKNKIRTAVYRRQTIVIATTKQVLAYFRKNGRELGPDLFALNWYRIILDEAHSIKNQKSLTKQSICALRAKHRWALTGTPLSNSADEFLPYLTFIGCNIDENKKAFRKEYMVGNKANDKFEALISMCMYRRTKGDTYLGYSILDIPPRETHDVWVPLSIEEEVIYKFVKDSCLAVGLDVNGEPPEESNRRDKLEATNKKTEKETKNSSLRSKNMYMRRLISHPYNIERLLRGVEEPSQIQELRNNLLAHQASKSVLEQLLSDETGRSNLGKYESGLTQIRKYEDDVFGGRLQFWAHLEAIQNELEAHAMQCGKCEQFNPEHPLRLKGCGHTYCNACYWSIVQQHRFPQNKSLAQICPVDGCTESFADASEFLTMPTIVDRALGDKTYRPPDVDSNRVTLKRDKDQTGCFVASSYLPNLSMIPNSRLTTAMTVLLSWRIDYPDDKIIVFTENVMTAKIFGTMLNKAAIEFVYYYGCIGEPKKSQNLDMFTKNASIKVLLAGLKAGGQGLNITCANRVIIVDPWWNVTSELQAAGRTHRIGQKKSCWVVRIFTSAATDGRVAELQKAKSKEIDHALQDDGHVPQELDDARRQELFNVTEGKGSHE